MQDEVRELLYKYGYAKIRSEVERQCRAVYEELCGLYSQSQPQQVQQVQQAQTQPPVQTKPKLVKKKSTGKEIPLVQVHKAETDSEESGPELEQEQESDEESFNMIVALPGPIQQTPYKQKSSDEKKQEKLEHRRAVQKKRQDLLAKGVNPEDLLTKENLEKWLNAGLSYQRIAREQTGCHENDISAVAKLHGLKSKIANYVFMRHTQ